MIGIEHEEKRWLSFEEIVLLKIHAYDKKEGKKSMRFTMLCVMHVNCIFNVLVLCMCEWVIVWKIFCSVEL